MGAREEIFEFYDEWRELSTEEAAAIGKNEWSEVNQCQNRKAALQKLIIQRSPQLHSECTPAEQEAHDQELRCVISELISMERRNGELIAEKKDALADEIHGLDKSSRNLSRIKEAYASKPQAAWFSYS